MLVRPFERPLTSVDLRSLAQTTLKGSLDHLIDIGVFRTMVKGTSRVLEFSRDFREAVLEHSVPSDRGVECSGLLCEARSSIRQAVRRVLSEKISNGNTIGICAELFLLEHGKIFHELNQTSM
ncbi:MAG: hypothetical protein ACE1ZC_05470 [Nitrososphaerales archaeon]